MVERKNCKMNHEGKSDTSKKNQSRIFHNEECQIHNTLPNKYMLELKA